MIFNRKRLQKVKEQLEDAESLVRALEAFIFVAKTDRKESRAVQFIDQEIQQYNAKWKNP